MEKKNQINIAFEKVVWFTPIWLFRIKATKIHNKQGIYHIYFRYWYCCFSAFPLLQKISVPCVKSVFVLFKCKNFLASSRPSKIKWYEHRNLRQILPSKIFVLESKVPEICFYTSSSVCLKCWFQDYCMKLTLALWISANVSVFLVVNK